VERIPCWRALTAWPEVRAAFRGRPRVVMGFRPFRAVLAAHERDVTEVESLSGGRGGKWKGRVAGVGGGG